MAAPTINNRWITVNGPIKIEYIHITDSTSNDETVITTLQRPVTVQIKAVNYDLAAGVQDAASADFSGKTITLRDPAASREYLLTVHGF